MNGHTAKWRRMGRRGVETQKDSPRAGTEKKDSHAATSREIAARQERERLLGELSDALSDAQAEAADGRGMWWRHPSDGYRREAEASGWWCVLQEHDGRRCPECEYKRQTPRRAVCSFLGVTIPRAQLRGAEQARL